MAQIDEIKKARLESAEKARELGWEPYAPNFDKQHTIVQACAMEGQVAKTAGKVVSSRSHGNITFMDVRDPSGSIQLFFQGDILGKEAYKNLRYIDTGDYVGVEGMVMKTTAGEISIQPTSYTLLTKALLPLPDEWYGLKDVETRYRKRYLDLMTNENVRHIFALRTKVISLLRRFMDEHGFMEVETPMLQPLYGGTTAKPFITHYNALDIDFYLRIAVELYHKRLIIGGYEKVYEMGKNFRNEGFSRAHNPEFTMLEFYWAYADYQQLMDFTEQMLNFVIQETKGSLQFEYQGKMYDFSSPWQRKTYKELYQEYLQIDIDDINTEEKLAAVVQERSLLEKPVVGYGFMLDEVYKKHIRPQIEGPLFLTDHPIELKPLAKRAAYDPTKSAGFQLVVDGLEFINAYNELNDPIDQRNRWVADMELGERGGEEYQMLDEDYIEALSYGMPPTAGWGMGIDRFVAFLANQHAIKDVILFPTMKPERNSETRADVSHVSPPVGPNTPSANGPTLTRDEAIEILEQHITNKNLQNHCKAVGATMRALAGRLGGNTQLWEIAGLLHDADWEETQNAYDQHTLKTIEWIKEAGETNQELIDCILAHNHHHNGFRMPETPMEWALYTCDELTGFIVAVALTRPDKKLASVEVSSVLKKFPQVAFAKPVDREQIKLCEEKLGIPLEEFVGITLQAMQEISDDLNL
jgi:lysyl-tRNA synthetase class 2